MLPMDVISKGAKCEKLETIAVDDDLEKFFKSKLNCLLRRRRSCWLFLERTLMYLLRVPIKLLG